MESIRFNYFLVVIIFVVNMIMKKKVWNGDSNTWDGRFHPIRGKKWWNGDPNTWDGRFYIPEETKKEIERKIKNILS